MNIWDEGLIKATLRVARAAKWLREVEGEFRGTRGPTMVKDGWATH